MSELPVVVKLGGTTIAEEQDVLREITLEARRRPIVVVHGGGKRLTSWLGRLGVESHFDAGLRVTDEATLEVALAVLGGLVNGELVAALRGLGADAVGLRGLDGGTVSGAHSPRLGRVIPEPTTDPALLRQLLDAGRLPVLASLGLDEQGRICNVNADDAAASIAAALGGELVLMTDTDGVRGADGERIGELTPSEAERLIEEGVIAGGMVPKVRCALRAVSGTPAAKRAVIVDGRRHGALSAALDAGAGAGSGTGFRIG